MPASDRGLIVDPSVDIGDGCRDPARNRPKQCWRAQPALHHAELVALRVLEHAPPGIPAVVLGDQGGAEADEPQHLDLPVVRQEVDVHPVLRSLLFRHSAGGPMLASTGASRSGSMRAGWAIGAGVLAAALIMAGPASAVPVVAEPAALPTIVRAEDPVTFGSSHIVDKVGALGNRESEVTASLDRLFADTGTDLFVVYVANFTGAADRQAWTDQTAARNGMGATDVLLAVATADRQYQISVAPEFTLTDAQLSEVESVAIETALHENDWAGAAIGAADGLRASLRGEAVVAPDITPGNAYPGGGGGATVWIVLIVIAGIGAILFLVLRRRRRPGIPAGTTPEALPAVPTPKLKQQASSALVQTDDAIKTSEQELGFAIAQYGADATGAFQTALDAAKAQLSQGFTLQQRLDDAEPDSEQQQRAWYAEIITLCQKANQALDEQAADFDELRQLEKKAPEAAASLARDIEAARARLTATQASLATLGEGYTQAAIATVADNPRQAEDRITFASASLAAANERIAAGEPSAAAVGIRAAEDSVDQAKLLLDAVDRLGADLQAAAGSVTKVVADLETDLVTARALPDGGCSLREPPRCDCEHGADAGRRQGPPGRGQDQPDRAGAGARGCQPADGCRAPGCARRRGAGAARAGRAEPDHARGAQPGVGRRGFHHRTARGRRSGGAHPARRGRPAARAGRGPGRPRSRRPPWPAPSRQERQAHCRRR